MGGRMNTEDQNTTTEIAKQRKKKKATKAAEKETAKLIMRNPQIAAFGCGCIGIALIFVGVAAMSFFAIMNGGGSYEDLNLEDKRNDISAEEWKQIFTNAEQKINVPWEVSAAIVYNETGGGKNFGGCSYNPEAPGNGHVLTSGNGLRSPGDKEAFDRTVNGINYPKNEPVSCNPAGSNGGAMGYMQIMPKEWESYSGKIIDAGISSGTLNPWDAQDASYVAALIIKCKLGGSHCKIEEAFPENETSIKKAAGGYHGSGALGSYAARVYAKYLEFKAAGEITK